MNKSHEMYLYGMQVDWQDGLNNRGFTFKNPNASTTCGAEQALLFKLPAHHTLHLALLCYWRVPKVYHLPQVW